MTYHGILSVQQRFYLASSMAASIDISGDQTASSVVRRTDFAGRVRRRLGDYVCEGSPAGESAISFSTIWSSSSDV